MSRDSPRILERDSSKFSQVDLEWATRLNRVSLQLLGLWPEAERVPRERLRCHLRAFAALLMIVLGVLLPCVHSLIITEKDIMQMIEHLQFILPTVTSVIRLMIFWWKKEGTQTYVRAM